jgi:hypothetical protein
MLPCPTCANAAVSDRNGYMIDLTGIYKHFGQMPKAKSSSLIDVVNS